MTTRDLPAAKRGSTIGALARHATFRQLQTFEAVARLGSFTRAAEELYLAQPTVSMQLKKLTDAVGLPLFEQHGIRIHLTDAGRELYGVCQEVFHALANFEMKVEDMKGLKRGSLRLGVISSAQYLAPYLLGQFHERHSGVDVSLSVTNRERLLERIVAYMDDLYILGQPPPEIDVAAYPLVPNPLVVMASRDHPLVGERNIPLARLLEEHFILREPGSGTRAAVIRLFESKDLAPPIAKMELASNEAIKHVISANLGISVMSLHALALEGTDGPIAILDVQGFPIERHWYLVHPRDKKVSIIAQSFLALVREQGQEIGEKFDREIAKIRQKRSTKQPRAARGKSP